MSDAGAREAALRTWAQSVLAHDPGDDPGDDLGDDLSMSPLAGDASFRRYFRLRRAGQTWVLMDAPPPQEEVATFCRVGEMLRAAGLNAPRIIAADPALGFLVLEDLGDDLYLDALRPDTASRLYDDAIAALVQMQRRIPPEGLPAYDRDLLAGEMTLFPEWYVTVHLRATLTSEEQRGLDDAFEVLIQAALEQPRVFVHRDFHSRNLLVHSRNPGILDFQDAVHGPASYDLVSLLRDVYISWSPDELRVWMGRYLDRAIDAGVLAPGDRNQFPRWFDLMGVQRHLKVAGIFARLNYRDGKPGYLRDLPLTLQYLQSVAASYPELEGLGRLIRRLRGG